jgi:phage-related holin
VQFFFHVTFVRFLQLPAGRFFVLVFFDVGDWVTGDTQPSTINLRTNYYKIQNTNKKLIQTILIIISTLFDTL